MRFKIKTSYFIGPLVLLPLMQLKALGSFNLKKLKKGIYDENLTPYRVEFYKHPTSEKKEPLEPLAIQGDETTQLKELLIRRKAAYKRMPDLKGFTIQVYMGSSRTAALKAQELAAALQATYAPLFHYRQPNYTVQLGFFTERLEAYFVYLGLVKQLPAAMIRPFMLKRTDKV